MGNEILPKPIDILLVEDSPTDADLTLRALKRGKIENRLFHVRDGVEAMAFLRREPPYESMSTPDLILLDLNMPRKDGREVLQEVRNDPVLKTIPIVVLTTSSEEQDILASYGLYSNAYIVKPVDLHQFFQVIQDIDYFWVRVVTLPQRS